MGELENSLCWVILRYDDGSARNIYTTLNPELLEREGAHLREGYFYDVRLQRYVPFDEEAESVEVYSEMPVWEGVMQFASKFI